jgi:hypothetical protein
MNGADVSKEDRKSKVQELPLMRLNSSLTERDLKLTKIHKN